MWTKYTIGQINEYEKKVKLKIYKSVYLPTVMYGAESWTVLEKHASRITSAGMKFIGE